MTLTVYIASITGNTEVRFLSSFQYQKFLSFRSGFSNLIISISFRFASSYLSVAFLLPSNKNRTWKWGWSKVYTNIAITIACWKSKRLQLSLKFFNDIFASVSRRDSTWTFLLFAICLLFIYYLIFPLFIYIFYCNLFNSFHFAVL